MTTASVTLTTQEREAIADAAARFGPMNRDLYTLVAVIAQSRVDAALKDHT
jgi:hypothetical protein